MWDCNEVLWQNLVIRDQDFQSLYDEKSATLAAMAQASVYNGKTTSHDALKLLSTFDRKRDTSTDMGSSPKRTRLPGIGYLNRP